MKKQNKYVRFATHAIAFCLLAMMGMEAVAQDTTATDTAPAKVVKKKPVKNTFEGNWILDNQSVMVSYKGTLEMDIQHRFGTVNKGYKDLFGIYSPSNIRIGLSYVALNNLQVGLGFTKDRLQWDLTGKYAIVKQAISGGWPVSITYFGNIVADTRPKDNFVNDGDRISYFNQLLIARKISEKFSIQVAPSYSHYNNIEGFLDANGKVQKKMKNDQFAIAFMGKYKLTEKTNLLVNYDQPLTQHPMNNPRPNISFGMEMVTSGHTFQVFAGNYQNILPQSNSYFNQNDYTKGQF